jgi:hypothetical protein
MPHFLHSAYLLALMLLIFSPGCSLLIGNVKPIAEKSHEYEYLNLARESKDWTKLEDEESVPSTQDQKVSKLNAEPKSDESDSNDTNDVAFQSQSSASIISINSACRQRIEDTTLDLRSFTQELLLGVVLVTEKQEVQLTVSGLSALETTAQGLLNGQAVKIRTVVLRREDCIFDLMYVARPDRFIIKESEFKKFVQGFKLK